MSLTLAGIRLQVTSLEVITIPAVIILCRTLSPSALTAPACALWAYVAAAMISVVCMSEPGGRIESGLRVVRLFELSVPFILASTLKTSRTALPLLMKAFIGGGGIGLVVGLVMFGAQFSLEPTVQRFQGPYLYGTGHMARAMGVFSDTTAFAYLAVTWILVTLIASAQAAKPVMRYAGALAAAAMLQATAYATLSRSMLVNVSAAVLTVPVLRLGSETRRGVVKVAVAFLVCFVALVVVGAAAFPKLAATALKLVEERVFSALGSIGHGWEGLNTASSLRLEIWNTYLPFFRENPLTGIGYKALWIHRKLPPDNSYLGSLVETGMLGAVTLLSFLTLVTRGLLHAGRQAQEVRLFMALWVGLLVHAFFADVFTFWGTIPSVFVLIGSALQYGVSEPGGPDEEPGEVKR